MRPRILYVNGIFQSSVTKKLRILRELYGDAVSAPNLRTRSSLFWCGLWSAVILAWWVMTVVWMFAIPSTWVKALCLFLNLFFGLIIYLCLIHLSARYVVNRAIKFAEEGYDSQEPNIIVAEGLGAVIARRINRRKTAALFFNPLLEQYARWTRDRRHLRLDHYPYVCLVDERKPRSDTYRTLERASPDRCKLELLEYNATHQEISPSEMESFIDDCFLGGRLGAAQLALVEPDTAIAPEAFSD